MPIQLYRGDDSDFSDLREITLTLNAPFDDMTGWEGVFELSGFMQRFSDLSSGVLTLRFAARDTRRLDLGEHTGSFRMYDAAGRCKTIATNIPFEVVDAVNVVEEETDAITINTTIEEQAISLTFESTTLGAVLIGTDVYAVTGYNDKNELDLSDCTFGELCDLIGTLFKTLKEREIIK